MHWCMGYYGLIRPHALTSDPPYPLKRANNLEINPILHTMIHTNDKMITKDTKQWILMHTSEKITVPNCTSTYSYVHIQKYRARLLGDPKKAILDFI